MCNDCHWFSCGFKISSENHNFFFAFVLSQKSFAYCITLKFFFQANNLGVGVVGVIECDFLQPTHNKQDFDYTKAYRYNVVIYVYYFLSVIDEALYCTS